MSPPVHRSTPRVRTIVRKRTTAYISEEAATELADNTLFGSTDDRLEHYTVYISAVECRGQRAPVTVPQSRGVEGIGHLVIPAFLYNPTEILLRT